MKGDCVQGGAEYEIPSFHLDPGTCKACTPRFLSLPVWTSRTPDATRSLYRLMLAVHFMLLLLFGILLDAGAISLPGSLYCAVVLAYFGVRYAIGILKGFPVLTRAQALALHLLPIYGLAVQLSGLPRRESAQTGVRMLTQTHFPRRLRRPN